MSRRYGDLVSFDESTWEMLTELHNTMQKQLAVLERIEKACLPFWVYNDSVSDADLATMEPGKGIPVDGPL